jgi:hypothetical protein
MGKPGRAAIPDAGAGRYGLFLRGRRNLRSRRSLPHAHNSEAFMVDTVIVNPAAADEERISAVSWPAIIAGGFTAAALSVLLFALGAGIGLSIVSPWSDRGISSDNAALFSGIYLVCVAIMSSAVGGYIAGRLRVRWLGTHTDEVYFRDSAHGFLSWAVATVIGVVMVASAATSVGSGAAGGMGPAAAIAGNNGARQSVLNSYSDELLRPNFASKAADAAAAPSDRTEVYRLLSRSVGSKAMASRDHDYLVQMISARTGLPQADAEKRVNDVTTELKASADQARKSAAHLALWLTASMLCGALAAALTAIEGGTLRDRVYARR